MPDQEQANAIGRHLGLPPLVRCPDCGASVLVESAEIRTWIGGVLRCDRTETDEEALARHECPSRSY